MVQIRYGVIPDGQRWKLLREGQRLGSFDAQDLAIEAGRMAARAERRADDVQLDVWDYYGELRRADLGPPAGHAVGRPPQARPSV
jgi:hypothetical protein